jgi:hypothetical protein
MENVSRSTMHSRQSSAAGVYRCGLNQRINLSCPGDARRGERKWAIDRATASWWHSPSCRVPAAARTSCSISGPRDWGPVRQGPRSRGAQGNWVATVGACSSRPTVAAAGEACSSRIQRWLWSRPCQSCPPAPSAGEPSGSPQPRLARTCWDRRRCCDAPSNASPCRPLGRLAG